MTEFYGMFSIVSSFDKRIVLIACSIEHSMAQRNIALLFFATSSAAIGTAPFCMRQARIVIATVDKTYPL